MREDWQKARLELDGSDGIAGETLWVERIGNDLYRLLNKSVLDRSYARNDVVRCYEKNGRLTVGELVNELSNFRILFKKPDNHKVLDYLTGIGGSFEKTAENLYVFEIPAPPKLKISLRELGTYLDKLESTGFLRWEAGK